MAFMNILYILYMDLEISTVRFYCFKHSYSYMNLFCIFVICEARRWLFREAATCSIFDDYSEVSCMDGLSYCYKLHYHNGDDKQ